MAGESEKKRYYRLTGKGQEALDAEAVRLSYLALLVRTRRRKIT